MAHLITPLLFLDGFAMVMTARLTDLLAVQHSTFFFSFYGPAPIHGHIMKKVAAARP
jgi:hypothetical protein